MHKIIFFNSRDELLRISLEHVAYFEANGNYTNIVMVNGLRGTTALSLSRMADVLAEQSSTTEFMRAGKRFIINIRYIYQINIAKQRLILTDYRNFKYQLPISKEALKKIKEITLQTNIEL